MSTQFEWSNQMRNRQRTPSLYLVQDGNVHRFEGVPVRGCCAVVNSQYTKAGKWSGTDYTIAIADNVRAIEVCCGWDGWGQTWADIARDSIRELIVSTQPTGPEWIELVKRIAAAHIEAVPHTGLRAAVEAANANDAALGELDVN